MWGKAICLMHWKLSLSRLNFPTSLKIIQILGPLWQSRQSEYLSLVTFSLYQSSQDLVRGQQEHRPSFLSFLVALNYCSHGRVTGGVQGEDSGMHFWPLSPHPFCPFFLFLLCFISLFLISSNSKMSLEWTSDGRDMCLSKCTIWGATSYRGVFLPRYIYLIDQMRLFFPFKSIFFWIYLMT